jgi:immune inhibitor A
MKNQSWFITGAVALVIFTGFCLLCAVGIAGVTFYLNGNRTASAIVSISPTTILPEPTLKQPAIITAGPAAPTPTGNTPPVNLPVPTSNAPASLLTPTVEAASHTSALVIPGAVTETLVTLENATVPVNDPVDLVERLEGAEDLPRSLEVPVRTYQVGDEETFWVTNSESNKNFQVKAVLRYMTDHVYFWVDQGEPYNQKDMKALIDTFENKIYPTNRDFFGSEWTPGVDGDPHLFILYSRGLGGSVAGYFSSSDEYLPPVRQYSNGHEMFLLSLDRVNLDEQFAYSVLAHEFQHMIHWYRDRNEETWLNEGSANLAAFLNGFDIGGHDQVFARHPDIQLTYWPTDATNRTEHYGGAFLFMTYFLDRFGETATKALIADPANGMVSIDHVLADLNFKDQSTGKLETADNFFTDWLITNYVQDGKIAEGRYTYHNYPAAPDFPPTESISNCPVEQEPREVYQYGVNYIQIRCKGDYTIHFAGQSQVAVLPTEPHSGNYAFYSNRGDESDMTLTRTFDFTNNSGPLSLTYWTWYDLEKDYDYLYLTASIDGETWQILTTPSGTADNPSGSSYGWGYNGESGNGPAWIQEKVDLSEFAGKKVQIRFEYVTDAAVNGEGFLLDDVAVPETGYMADFESDAGDWQADGFARIRNSLPQYFHIAMITKGQETTVQKFDLAVDNNLDIPIQIGKNTREVILVVTGTTRFTHQKANYTLSILPK